MMNREQTVATLKHTLDQWNSEIDALDRKVDSFADDRRKDAKQTIQQLRDQRDEARASLEKLTKANDNAFGDLRSGVEKAWDTLSKSIEGARQRYH
jgi:chromosome segregation ATPase